MTSKFLHGKKLLHNIETTGFEYIQCGRLKIALNSSTFLSLRNGDIFPILFFFFLVLTRGHIFFIAPRERQGERETSVQKRSIDCLPPQYAQTGAWACLDWGSLVSRLEQRINCNLAMCPDWESNLQPEDSLTN